MAIEEWPAFTLPYCYRLTAVVLAPVVDLYLRPFVLLIFINMNLLDTRYCGQSVHPAYPTHDIWNAEFIIAGTTQKWFLAGTNKCKQLRSNLVGLPIQSCLASELEVDSSLGLPIPTSPRRCQSPPFKARALITGLDHRTVIGHRSCANTIPSLT